MKKVAIIGAGISGLFIANFFKRYSNYQINIFEKNQSINLEEGYGIQLSVNSVKFLNKLAMNSPEIPAPIMPIFFINFSLNIEQFFS